MRIVIGQPGGDGPVTIINTSTGEVTVQPGWQPEEMSELAKAAKVLQLAVSFKQPRLTEATVAAVREYVEEQVREHLGESASDATVLLL